MSILKGKAIEPRVFSADHEELIEARAKINGLTTDNAALRAQLEGDIPTATAWLQLKVWRQRAAADRMNRTIASQRFVLRTLQELGRGLSADEYATARKAVGDEQLRNRLFEKQGNV